MSGRLVGEVLRYAPIDLTLLERFVLTCIAEAAHENDRIARDGVRVEDLADKLQVHPRTIRTAIKELTDRRGLLIKLVGKPSKGHSQNYRIPRMTDATRTATHQRGAPARPLRPAKAAAFTPPEGGPTHPPLSTTQSGAPAPPYPPVDNRRNGHTKGGSKPLAKGGPRTPPPGTNLLPDTQVPATQLPAGLSR